jgi:hypothetical protein
MIPRAAAWPARLVQRDGALFPQLVGELHSERDRPSSAGDVLVVVAALGLGRRREDRLG